MAKRMLIDATHSEETRVVVLNGHRLEEFDFETSTKKQIKGNIYLAKITRVEPSLQAAFVEFGGNRHGFLAFSEIHPDYYRIPVSDRDRDRRDEREPRHGRGNGRSHAPERARRGPRVHDDAPHADAPHDDGPSAAEGLPPSQETVAEAVPFLGSDFSPSPLLEAADERGQSEHRHDEHGHAEHRHDEHDHHEHGHHEHGHHEPSPTVPAEEPSSEALAAKTAAAEPPGAADPAPSLPHDPPDNTVSGEALPTSAEPGQNGGEPHVDHAVGESRAVETAGNGHDVADSARESAAEAVEIVGGDEFEEQARQRSRWVRSYKIQEVVKRRQIMLVQVTKEERGTKGAALTTYLSLAGRYCVLMPNTGRGGGVSRKITSAVDRKRLKDLVEDLEVPDGMGIIVRTAGSERSKAEIKRDYEYLVRLWDEIRDLTLKSTAPALIYEEGNLIKRSIRDLYQRDIEEVLVEGEEGYKTAKAFMKMLMPSHAKRVQPYRDPVIPLLHRFQIESQLDAIHSPTVQLKSGGYIVINPTEALVAIDVNSGRSTKERNIEETATRTNLEAAEEIARQLRLRDLAGLIVIDFIDMEEHRNQASVERRLKEAMKHDRARIQVGRISPFGLLELSRQRLRPSIIEASTQPCAHCSGTGSVRSTESTALHVLRAIEEEGIRRRSAEIAIAVPTTIALYILNQKRSTLASIEQKYGFQVFLSNDDSLIPPAFRLERLKPLSAEAMAAPPALRLMPDIAADVDDLDADVEEEEEAEVAAEAAAPAPREPRASHEPRAPHEPRETREEGGSDDVRRRRRRRRRRRGGDERAPGPAGEREAHEGESEPVEAEGAMVPVAAAPHEDSDRGRPPGDDPTRPAGDDEERRRRRRGRRGGRRRRRDGEGDGRAASSEPAAEHVEFIDSGPVAAATPEVRSAFAETPFDRAGEVLGAEAIPVADEAEHRLDRRSEPVPAPPPVHAHGAAETVETVRATPPEAAAAPPARPEAPPEPQRDAERSAAPPPVVVTERPQNPKKGWWQRLVS
jgi:ribonuclease E